MISRVAALIATYRRPHELRRLLEALAQIPHNLEMVMVVDNAADPGTRAIVELAQCPARYVAAGENLGCGGGLKRAGEEAARVGAGRLTHFWILDDDALPTSQTLDGLLAAMEQEAADAACPLVLGPDERVGWTPGLTGLRRRRLAKKVATAAEFRRRIGTRPLPFTWAQGISLVVSRRAIDALGWHRDDFWVRGEDLEFSLRLTARYRGIFVPVVEVRHLPPAETGLVSRETEYLKHAAMLQNIACLGLRLPHGRRIAWTIPSNLGRFIWTWGIRAIPDAVRALHRGGLLAEPAGQGDGATFQRRMQTLADRSAG